MMGKPISDETVLEGSWKEVDGSVRQDAVCDRIQWLTDSFLEQLAVDGDNWSALYRNPEDGKYWELTYPLSEMHGGGPPTLSQISRDTAIKKYPETGIA